MPYRSVDDGGSEWVSAQGPGLKVGELKNVINETNKKYPAILLGFSRLLSTIRSYIGTII